METSLVLIGDTQAATAEGLRKRGFWKIPFFPPRNAAGTVEKVSSKEGKPKRGPFTAGVPVHAAPKFSVLSSEEVGRLLSLKGLP
jgi:hypothetical protein